MTESFSTATRLDEIGRCCGKKPRVYKRGDGSGRAERWCSRCNRSYLMVEAKEVQTLAVKPWQV
jgi:hypothetical protein